MNLINSKNRTPAKRLLNSFYNSKQVRVMTLSQLNDALQRAINSGLITVQGAERALGIQSRNDDNDRQHKYHEHDQKDNHESEQDDSDRFGDESNKHDDDDKDNDEKGEGEGNGSESGEDNREDKSESEDEAETEGDNDNDGDGDKGEDESEDGEEKDSESKAEQEQQMGQEEDTLKCECCGKECTQEELSAGEEGTEFEGEALCVECDALNNKAKEEYNKPLRHEMFGTILKWIRAGVNVALVGPAGSGKSTIVQHVCEDLKKEFRGCGALMSKYDLIGYKDANGTYHATPLFEAFTEGHVFCFDELDASAPDAVVSFNAATDNQNVFAFPSGMEQKHEGFIAVCCMNTWGNGATADYVGRFKQDAAAMSRFVKVQVGYDRKIEARIAGRKNLDIATRVWDLREACEALGIQHVASTRMIIQAVAGRSVKCTKTEIDRDVLFAGLNDDVVKQLKAALKARAGQRAKS